MYLVIYSRRHIMPLSSVTKFDKDSIKAVRKRKHLAAARQHAVFHFIRPLFQSRE